MISWLLRLLGYRRRPTIHVVRLNSLAHYERYLRGEITAEEYSGTDVKDESWYEDLPP